MLVPATALEINGAEPSAESPMAIPARRCARNAEQGDLESFPDDAKARRSLSYARSPSRVRLDAFSRSLPAISLPGYFDAYGDSNDRAMLRRQSV